MPQHDLFGVFVGLSRVVASGLGFGVKGLRFWNLRAGILALRGFCVPTCPAVVFRALRLKGVKWGLRLSR